MAADAKLKDRADYRFARLLPEGNTTVQQRLPPAGPYHVNHFICYFTVRGQSYTDAGGTQAAGLLTFAFLRNFCVVFSDTNIARAQIGPRGFADFDGSPVVEFTIGPNIGTVEHRATGFVHPDWVAMSASPKVTIDNIKDNNSTPLKSFHGDTLKRLWDTAVEEQIRKNAGTGQPSSPAGKIISAISPVLAQVFEAAELTKRTILGLLEVNRQHFLAGSRSWRVGYDISRKQFYVETMAIERYSCRLYQAADKVHSTRKDVLALWDNLLNNFIHSHDLGQYRFTAESPPKDLSDRYGYKVSPVSSYILHNAWEFTNLAALKAELHAAKLIPAMKTLKEAHPGLYVHVKE